MTITVKFFASLRERLHCGQVQLEFNASQTPLTLEQIWQQATQNAEKSGQILVAINKRYVNWQTLVQEGDEVAFFPPVTGG